MITLNELLQTFGLGKLAHVVVPQTTTIKEDFPEVDDREEAMPQLIKEFTFRADFGDIRSVGAGSATGRLSRSAAEDSVGLA